MTCALNSVTCGTARLSDPRALAAMFCDLTLARRTTKDLPDSYVTQAFAHQFLICHIDFRKKISQTSDFLTNKSF